MKGLVISIAAFLLYVALTALVAHFGSIRRYGRLFFPAVLLLSPFYFVLYALTPADCWILPDTWTGNPAWLELVYGYIVFLFNCHSYIDFFFGFTGGFSTSLLREILLCGQDGCSTQALASGFLTAEGQDKIYHRRIPHLAEAGLITVTGPEKLCEVTPKGRRWAIILSGVKKLLNLEKGG